LVTVSPFLDADPFDQAHEAGAESMRSRFDDVTGDGKDRIARFGRAGSVVLTGLARELEAGLSLLAPRDALGVRVARHAK